MENKIVLDCGTLKHTTQPNNNVNIQGVINKVYAPSKFGKKTTQGITIQDSTGQVFVKVLDAPFSDKYIGADIEINGAVWMSYVKKLDNSTQWMLDATGADVRYSPSESVTPIKPMVKQTPAKFNDEMISRMSDCFDISLNFLSSPALSDKLAVVKSLGWSSEDCRTLAVSLFIEINRNKGLIR